MAMEATTTNQADQRDLRAGGWFWIQNELMEVFLPQIGCEGVAVYLALCRLIPRAEKADAGISIGTIASLACVPKAVAERKVSRMVDLGMVRKFPSLRMGPARFELADLKDMPATGGARTA